MASNATGMPLVTNQPEAGEIGLMTVVVGGLPSIFSVMLLPVASSTLPAVSTLQYAMVCVPLVANANGPT